MLHACDQRFDVTENLENFCELNKAIVLLLLECIHGRRMHARPSWPGGRRRAETTLALMLWTVVTGLISNKTCERLNDRQHRSGALDAQRVLFSSKKDFIKWTT